MFIQKTSKCVFTLPESYRGSFRNTKLISFVFTAVNSDMNIRFYENTPRARDKYVV